MGTIGYMSTNPGHPDIEYPKVLAEKILQSHVSEVYTIECLTHNYGDKNVHVSTFLPLGKIPPGEMTLAFKILEFDSNRQVPFRLVSLMITQGEVKMYRGDHYG